jgi:hypothetical protein
VAFSVDGVTTGFGVFCDADSVSRVASLLVAMPAVDVVTQRVNDSLFTVQWRDSAGVLRMAQVAYRRLEGEERYRYASERNDPLELDGTVQRMREAGVLDADGASLGDVHRQCALSGGAGAHRARSPVRHAESCAHPRQSR